MKPNRLKHQRQNPKQVIFFQSPVLLFHRKFLYRCRCPCEKEELTPAIEFAFKEGNTILIESFLDGTEVTCGVYRKKSGVYALPLTEIASENEFFDYEAKYLGKSQEITPARVSDDIKIQVQTIAKRIYQLLQLKSISRIDFMIVNNIPHVIEVNTTPGFSTASIVPQMIACDGNTINGFWTEIFEVEIK